MLPGLLEVMRVEFSFSDCEGYGATLFAGRTGGKCIHLWRMEREVASSSIFLSAMGFPSHWLRIETGDSFVHFVYDGHDRKLY